MVIKKGSIFVITAGEYSDYTMISIFKAKEDIDIMVVRDEYLSLYPEQNVDYHFSDYQFAKWLCVDKKVCRELDYFEWHVAGCGIARFSLDEGNKLE